MDGHVIAGLLLRAGFDITDRQYVAPGQAIKGRINVDTGHRDGFVAEDGGETAYIDHHTISSGSNNSATKIAYEILTREGLLERSPHLDKLVEFVTNCDNMLYPPEEYGKKSARTLIGLRKNLTFHQLETFFINKQNPKSPIPEAKLQKIIGTFQLKF